MPRQNTGSVFQRKDGLWIAQVTRNGKRIVKCANSQQEAEQDNSDNNPVTVASEPVAIAIEPPQLITVPVNFAALVAANFGDRPVAQLIADRYFDRLRYATDLKTWYTWKGQKWIIETEALRVYPKSGKISWQRGEKRKEWCE